MIRLPFIIHTSYPHEILHNWWGNSVFIDYQTGNWAEGLTSYLADHLLKEQRGAGADYRRNSLQKYADYVAESKDFPLTAFRSNHGDVSQAVGYNKTLMLFHMLRMKIGDTAFIEGLRRFYQDNQFHNAAFDDLRKAFEASSHMDLRNFFIQWTTRTGAPSLKLNDVNNKQVNGDYLLTGEIQQIQRGDPFKIDIPLFVQLENETQLQNYSFKMTQKNHRFTLRLNARPVKLSIDPRFDLFRKLHSEELPASLGQLFGANKLSIILPSKAPTKIREAYRQLAESWQQRGTNIDLLWDNKIKQPPDHSLWFFGRENRFADKFNKIMQKQGVTLNSGNFHWQDNVYNLAKYSLAVAHRPDDLGWSHLYTSPASETTLGFISAPSTEALATLARKLPHYGRYSYTLFEGAGSTNRLKGTWELNESPLTVKLVEKQIAPIPIPKVQPLTTAIEK